MNFFWILSMLISGTGAQNQSFVVTPPEIFVTVDAQVITNVNGVWMYHNRKFNGYLIEFDKTQLISKLPIVDGREHGTAYGWFADGTKKYERNFAMGNREGCHKGWYGNGKLAFEYFFKNDKYQGEQKSFFRNGRPWQSLMYVNGYEEGKQKSWNEEGRLINNFTVKNGKLYGVIGRYDCMSVNQNK